MFVSPAYLLDDVHEMIRAWDSDHIRSKPGFPDTRQLFLRLHLIQEELSEFLEASRDLNLNKALDALGDLDVVVTGTWFTLGLQHIRRHCESEPIAPASSPPAGFPAERVLLNLSFQLQRELSRLAFAFAERDLKTTIAVLRSLDAWLTEAWFSLGLSPVRQTTSAEILRSNLSKLDPSTGKVVKTPSGRILKGPAYSPPDLNAVLLQHILSSSDGLADGEAACGCGDLACAGE